MLDLYDHPTMADRVKALEPSRAVLDEIWGSHEAKAKG